MVITRKLSPGDPGTVNYVRSQRETSIHNKGDMPERTFAPRQGPAVGVASGRFSKSRQGEWSWYAGDFVVTGSLGKDAYHDHQEN